MPRRTIFWYFPRATQSGGQGKVKVCPSGDGVWAPDGAATMALDVIIDDYARLMDSLGVGRFHLVAAKIGGVIARAFAARRPERVATLTVIGSPPPLRKGAERIPALTEEFETKGVEHWARRTMA